MTASEILAALAAPFDPAQVSWRVGSISKKDKNRAQALCYVDARDVMKRLDKVMGADWQCEYINLANGTTCCRIGLKIDGEWRWRSNGAGATDIEGEKGGFSDAFKRAAVLWGVSQYLYDMDSPWVDIDDWKKIKEHEMARLRGLLGETRAHERAPARQEPEPSRSETPAPVDPKKAALDRKAEAAAQSAKIAASKLQEGKEIFAKLRSDIKAFRERLEGGERVGWIRRDWDTWLPTTKLSAPKMSAEDQQTIRDDVRDFLGDLKFAEKSQLVAA